MRSSMTLMKLHLMGIINGEIDSHMEKFMFSPRIHLLSYVPAYT